MWSSLFSIFNDVRLCMWHVGQLLFIYAALWSYAAINILGDATLKPNYRIAVAIVRVIFSGASDVVRMRCGAVHPLHDPFSSHSVLMAQPLCSNQGG